MPSLKLPVMKSLLVALLLALVCATGEAPSPDQHADKLTSLIDPAKLATLRERGANPRVQKAVEGERSTLFQPRFSNPLRSLPQRALDTAESQTKTARREPGRKSKAKQFVHLAA